MRQNDEPSPVPAETPIELSIHTFPLARLGIILRERGITADRQFLVAFIPGSDKVRLAFTNRPMDVPRSCTLSLSFRETGVLSVSHPDPFMLLEATREDDPTTLRFIGEQLLRAPSLSAPALQEMYFVGAVLQGPTAQYAFFGHEEWVLLSAPGRRGICSVRADRRNGHLFGIRFDADGKGREVVAMPLRPARFAPHLLADPERWTALRPADEDGAEIVSLSRPRSLSRATRFIVNVADGRCHTLDIGYADGHPVPTWGEPFVSERRIIGEPLGIRGLCAGVSPFPTGGVELEVMRPRPGTPLADFVS